MRSWSIPEDERSVVRRRGEDVSGKLGTRAVEAEIGGTGFSLAADVGVRPHRMDCVLWPRSCMKEGITRVEVPRRVMFDVGACSNGQEVEQVEVEFE